MFPSIKKFSRLPFSNTTATHYRSEAHNAETTEPLTHSKSVPRLRHGGHHDKDKQPMSKKMKGLLVIENLVLNKNFLYELMSLLIDQYIDRLSPCIHAQSKLQKIVNDLAKFNDEITTISLQAQWQTINSRAFQHWKKQFLQLQYQLSVLALINDDGSRNSQSQGLEKKRLCFNQPLCSWRSPIMVMEPEQTYIAPLYLIFSAKLDRLPHSIAFLSNLWNHCQFQAGVESTLHYLCSSAADLTFIDLCHQDTMTSTLCQKFHVNHPNKKLLGVLIKQYQDSQGHRQQETCDYPFDVLTDYCWWTLENFSWEKWKDWLTPLQKTDHLTLNYVKRIK